MWRVWRAHVIWRHLVVAVAGTTVIAVAPTHGAAQPPEHDSQTQPGGHQQHMEHRFDDPGRYAQSFDDPARDEWQLPTRVIEALDIQPGQRVADLGAGTGYFTMRLTDSTDADRVYAVDTYHHIADRVAYFRRLRSDLRQGGRVAIVDFRKDSPSDHQSSSGLHPNRSSMNSARPALGYALNTTSSRGRCS